MEEAGRSEEDTSREESRVQEGMEDEPQASSNSGSSEGDLDAGDAEAGSPVAETDQSEDVELGEEGQRRKDRGRGDQLCPPVSMESCSCHSLSIRAYFILLWMACHGKSLVTYAFQSNTATVHQVQNVEQC